MMSFSKLVLVVFGLFVIVKAGAQPAPNSYQRGIVANPCAQAIPQGHQLNLDFAHLCKYEKQNTLLPESNMRVVYFGDSITELWANRMPGLESNGVVNRGIIGQTTAQMLVRFRADVLNLKPKVLHMMMGTNDIAGNTGATSLVRIQNNISTMAELARAHGIRVVIGSILPSKQFTWRKEIQPISAIRSMNDWLKSYAASQGFAYADYYSAMKDANLGLMPTLSNDGTHPNASGYEVMYPIAKAAIEQAVR